LVPARTSEQFFILNYTVFFQRDKCQSHPILAGKNYAGEDFILQAFHLADGIGEVNPDQ